MMTQGRVLKALHAGAHIRAEYNSAGHKMYRLSTTGKTITPTLMSELIAGKLVRANGDGLPGMDDPQRPIPCGKPLRAGVRALITLSFYPR
jgi:hypothetical protein